MALFPYICRFTQAGYCTGLWTWQGTGPLQEGRVQDDSGPEGCIYYLQLREDF